MFGMSVFLCTGKKVTDGHLCLFCNQHFQNQTAVQRHMESKGHTKLGYEENYLLEYEEFFDFSPEGEGEESDAPSGRVDDDLALDGSGYEMTLPSGMDYIRYGFTLWMITARGVTLVLRN